MRKYASFLTVLAVAAAEPFRHRGRDRDYAPDAQAMNVPLDGFADVIDETQLSLELYFYARELNRADHVQLGLAPPGTGLLPPGEADVFAARGETH